MTLEKLIALGAGLQKLSDRAEKYQSEEFLKEEARKLEKRKVAP